MGVGRWTLGEVMVTMIWSWHQTKQTPFPHLEMNHQHHGLPGLEMSRELYLSVTLERKSFHEAKK